MYRDWCVETGAVPASSSFKALLGKTSACSTITATCGVPISGAPILLLSPVQHTS